MKIKLEFLKSSSAGALLFAIITAFVLTMVASTLVLFTTNQYKIIDSEVDRIWAFYRAQAGMEYAVWYAYTNSSLLPTPGNPRTVTGHGLTNTTVTITKLPATGFQSISNYGIKVRVEY